MIALLAAVPASGQSLVVTHVAGSSGGPGSNDGTTSTARFNAPMDVAISAAGALYVADSWNQTIRKVDATGVTTIAGLAGQKGSTDDVGPFARFNQPRGLTVDTSGSVYVADTLNHTIRAISTSGVVTTYAGSPGLAGSADGTGSAARFSKPRGIAVHGTTVYVADAGNYTIRRITAGGVVTTLAGQAGQYGSTDGTGSAARFTHPGALDVDAAGNLYVTDSCTIRRVTAAGVVTTLAGQAGQYGSTDGTGSAARFEAPSGLVADAGGTLYVTDLLTFGNGIRRVTTGGVVTTLISGNAGYADGPSSAATFWGAMGLAVDSLGALYIADTWNHAIRRVGIDLAFTTVAGNPGRFGVVDGTGEAARFGLGMMGWSSGDMWYYGPPNAANAHGGLATDGTGTLYVADSANRTIRKVTSTGVVTTLAGTPGGYGDTDGVGSAASFASPEGVAVDRLGNVYVAEGWAGSYGSVVRKITNSGVVTTLAGSPGQQGSTDGIGSAARFDFPRGIAVDRNGILFVADSSNCAIRKVSPDGVVTTFAGSPGQCGSTDGVGSAARFSGVRGVAVDGVGNVFVADYGNSTIRKITPAGLVTTLAGAVGQYNVVDGVGTSAHFGSPIAITVDDAGNAYVADEGNAYDESSRWLIRKITSTGVVTTAAGGIIQAVDGTGGAARFRVVAGVAADHAGNVYALDGYGVRKGTPGPRRFETYTPANIPDVSSVDSPLTVSDVTGVIDRVTVSVHIKHTWDNDLTLSLVGPDATTVDLSVNHGGSSDNYGTAVLPDSLRTTFDDQASTAIADGSAPFVGTYRPEASLSAFAGKSGSGVNGTWYLRVQDAAGGDRGVIAAWSLDLHLKAPVIGSVSPRTGSPSGGATLTINGQYFSTWPLPDVRVGGVAVTVTSVAPDGSWVQVTAPPLGTGPASITVTNPDGTTAFLEDAFVAVAPPFDFDHDRRSDVAVYRPSAGTWFWLKSSVTNQDWGYRGWGVQAQGDVPAPGDYDGDGVLDPTVFRPSTGTWFILTSSSQFTDWMWFGWGTTDDTVVPADYDGDGITDGAIFRPSTGTWYIRPSANPSAAWWVAFGAGADVPVPADYDGDGKTDIAVYRPSSGTWFVLKSSSGFTDWFYQGWGVQAQNDQPVPGDYDGDGAADIAVYRSTGGTWFILNSSTNRTTWEYFGWGSPGDVPVPADYDGDGVTDGAVYRPSTGEWYVRPSGGAAPWSVPFGVAGDVPLPKRQ